jgi:glycine cleavage system H lipoate-binding protein
MENSAYSVIPQGELKCVWMDAGVTAFKLCNLELRCESCAFNKTILEKQQELTDAESASAPSEKEKALTAEALFKKTLKKQIEGLKNAEPPRDRLYNRSSFWIQETEAGTYRLGINHILARFFQPILSLVVSKAPINIHRNDPFCWIILPGGAITLRSPVDATITRFNPALQQKPNMLSSASFSNGWLMELSAKSKGINSFGSYTETKRHLEKSLHNIEYSFTQAFKHHNPSAGTTLFDGGTTVESLERIIDSKVYIEVVNRILHLP